MDLWDRLKLRYEVTKFQTSVLLVSDLSNGKGNRSFSAKPDANSLLLQYLLDLLDLRTGHTELLIRCVFLLVLYLELSIHM